MNRESRQTMSDDEVRAAYLEFMCDATRTILPLEPNEACEQRFLEVNKPFDRAEFERRLSAMTADQRRKFEAYLTKGFSPTVPLKAKRRWNRLLGLDQQE